MLFIVPFFYQTFKFKLLMSIIADFILWCQCIMALYICEEEDRIFTYFNQIDY